MASIASADVSISCPDSFISLVARESQSHTWSFVLCSSQGSRGRPRPQMYGLCPCIACSGPHQELEDSFKCTSYMLLDWRDCHKLENNMAANGRHADGQRWENRQKFIRQLRSSKCTVIQGHSAEGKQAVPWRVAWGPDWPSRSQHRSDIWTTPPQLSQMGTKLAQRGLRLYLYYIREVMKTL